MAYREDKVPRQQSQFWFDKRCIGQDGLTESIGRGCVDSEEGSSKNFVTKVSNCRYEIARWRKNNTPYGKEKISELQQNLEEIQTDNNRTQEEIMDVSRKLHEVYKDEKESWQQKRRTMWHTSRDLNTNFYHALRKQRRTRNRIVGLHDAYGYWITGEKEVEKVAVDYFDNLFSTTSLSDFESFLEEITPSITYQMNQRLIRIAIEEEVRQTLFMMHPEKAHGPDGMTSLFFQHSWPIIKNDLNDMVNNFLLSRIMDTRLNITNIFLIPKTERP